MAIGLELAADGAIGADDVLLGPVDEVQDDGAALDMAEEAMADPGALARALDEAGQVGDDELDVVEPRRRRAAASAW